MIGHYILRNYKGQITPISESYFELCLKLYFPSPTGYPILIYANEQLTIRLKSKKS